MNGDLREAVQMLAADNARLCSIAEAADALAKVVEKYAHVGQRALEDYKIARQGQ